MGTYTIIKKDGTRYKVTTDDKKRTQVRSSSGYGSGGAPTVYYKSSGRKSTTAKITKIAPAPQEQTAKAEIPLQATQTQEVIKEPLIPVKTLLQTQKNNNYSPYNIIPPQQTQITQEAQKKSRFSENIEAAQYSQAGQSYFVPTKIASTPLNIPSINYNKLYDATLETGSRTAGFFAYTGDALWESIKDITSGEQFYTTTPITGGVNKGKVLREKSYISQDTKDLFEAGSSFIYGGDKYINSLKLQDIKDNPLNILPAIADTSFKIGAISTIQKGIDSSRLQTTVTKQGGVISTKAKGETIDFSSKEFGKIKIKLEQPYTGVRVPKSLGGAGNDPIINFRGYYTSLDRGGATLTKNKFLGEPIAKTTSESFLTIKDTKGKLIIDKAITQQSRGVSTSDFFSQNTQVFDPLTGKPIGKKVYDAGSKLSFKQDGLYSVKQFGFSTDKSFGISGFREDIAKTTGGIRTSSGATKADNIQLKSLLDLNTKGQILIHKPITETIIKPPLITTKNVPISSLFSPSSSSNIYGLSLIPSRSDTPPIVEPVIPAISIEKNFPLWEINKKISVSGEKLDLNDSQENIIQPIVKPINITKPDSKDKTDKRTTSDLISLPNLITQPSPVLITRPQETITRTVPLITRSPPKTGFPPFFMLPIPTSYKQGASFGSAYDVLVRRKGIFSKANVKPLTKQSAINFGTYKVGATAAATFKLQKVFKTPTTQPLKGNISNFYRKKGLFIEKRGKRIKSSSIGELQEITFKGIRASKEKKKKKKEKAGIFGGAIKWA